MTILLKSGRAGIQIKGRNLDYSWTVREDGSLECVLDPDETFGGPFRINYKPDEFVPHDARLIRETLKMYLSHAELDTDIDPADKEALRRFVSAQLGL